MSVSTPANVYHPAGTDVPALAHVPGVQGVPEALVDPGPERESQGPETGPAPSVQGQGPLYGEGHQPSCRGHLHQPKINQFPEVGFTFHCLAEYFGSNQLEW